MAGREGSLGGGEGRAGLGSETPAPSTAKRSRRPRRLWPPWWWCQPGPRGHHASRFLSCSR